MTKKMQMVRWRKQGGIGQKTAQEPCAKSLNWDQSRSAGYRFAGGLRSMGAPEEEYAVRRGNGII
jgi:hypothetical protein